MEKFKKVFFFFIRREKRVIRKGFFGISKVFELVLLRANLSPKENSPWEKNLFLDKSPPYPWGEKLAKTGKNFK